MTLNKICDLQYGHEYRICGIQYSNSDDAENDDFLILQRRMYHLGIIEGAKFRLLRRSIFKSGPLLLEVEGQIIAISPREADWILYE